MEPSSEQPTKIILSVVDKIRVTIRFLVPRSVRHQASFVGYALLSTVHNSIPNRLAHCLSIDPHHILGRIYISMS